tara:strand:+ start:235 stop:405 length:171 start_codon:yes stop_codon:yes gene_type:complete
VFSIKKLPITHIFNVFLKFFVFYILLKSMSYTILAGGIKKKRKKAKESKDFADTYC